MQKRKESKDVLPAFLSTKSDNLNASGLMRQTRKDIIAGNNGSLERIEERIPANARKGNAT